MTGFINQVLQRHTEPTPVISPRLPGLFEASTANSPVDTTPVLNDTGILTEQSDSRTVHEWQAPPSNPVHHPEDRKLSPNDTHHDTLVSSPFFIPLQEEQKQSPDIYNNVIHQEQVHHNYYPVNAQYYTLPAAPAVNETVILQENMEVPVSKERMNDTEPVQPVLLKPDDMQLKTSQRIVNKDVIQSSSVVLPVIPGQHESTPPVTVPIIPLEHTTIIKVSIGRIEVKAVSPPAPVKKQRSTPATPHMSLEEYLTKRNNSGK